MRSDHDRIRLPQFEETEIGSKLLELGTVLGIHVPRERAVVVEVGFVDGPRT